ncbi:MAG: hypothetical protein ACREOZ_04375, partial [Gloeomargaritales cyanobacterium]
MSQLDSQASILSTSLSNRPVTCPVNTCSFTLPFGKSHPIEHHLTYSHRRFQYLSLSPADFETIGLRRCYQCAETLKTYPLRS